MPARSKAQRKLMAIAEHHPDQVYSRNRGVLGMNAGQLHDFAATSEKNKLEHVKGSIRDISTRQRSPAVSTTKATANVRGGSKTGRSSGGGSGPIRNLGRFAHPRKG